MKKALIILAVFALLVTSAAFMVQASEEIVYCPYCNQNVPTANWENWDFSSGDIQRGHYRLTDDFFGQTETIKIPEEEIVCLDLNGHTYAASNLRMFNIEGMFNIMDSKGGGLILSTGENGTYGGFALVQSSGTFKLYGGTIRYSSVPGVSLYAGALFYVNGGRVDIYDGVVAGGTVSTTTKYYPQGGNFHLTSGGRLYVRGGKITQGIALKTTNSAQGGNIYASGNSQVVISGGFVENGYSDTGGGNIFIANATLEITDGTIQNGHALVSGGNIMANAAVENTIKISGGKITGGVAGGTYGTYTNNTFTRGTKGGGNIYEQSPEGILNITGGTIDGDIVLDYLKTMTLSGSPKIGLGKSSGMVFTDSGTIKANATGLTADAEIYVQSSRVFTTAFASADAAQTALGYFKGAVRTAISVTNTNTLQGTEGTEGYCPHCKESVTWKNLNTTDSVSDHCYLSGSLVRSKNLSVGNSLILDLNGYTLHQENTRFIFNYNSADSNLTILDTWAGGKIQGTGTGNANGGLFYIYPNSKFELLSGTLRLTTPILDTTTSTDNIVKVGGVIYANSNATVNISGGVIINGSVTAAGGSGGNICMKIENDTAGKLNISAGIIKNGNAAGLSGGNIYSASPVEITGGVILGGTAKNGGNLYTAGTFKFSDGLILNGNATDLGGNLYPSGGADISGGLIAKGTATTGGGNIGAYGSEIDIYKNAVIVGGNSSSRGGNIAVGKSAIVHISGGLISTGNATTRGGNFDTATETAKVNIDGGTIALGTSENGGNLYINNGVLNMTGGRVVGGKAKNGGNIYFNYYIYGTIKDDGDTETPLPRVSHGNATSGSGGNIYFTAAEISTKYYLHLGSCDIRNGNASGNGDNIYVSEKGLFKVLTEFNQSTTVFFHASRNPVKGGLLTESYTVAEGNFSGQLRLENISPNPLLCWEDGNIRVTATAIVKKDGTSRWFGNNADAVKNYSDDAAYMIVDEGDLVLNGGNYTVDLAGQNVNISGSGTLSCFDSANDDYSKFGTATVNGPTLTNIASMIFNENIYVTVASEEGYSFHRLDMGVGSVSIRPSCAGAYYSCTWNCDDVLAERLSSFGIAVSLDHMPTEDFKDDLNVIYTQSGQDSFQAGETANSVLIANILQNNNTNNDLRGRSCIYATPYITVLDENGQEHAVVALEVDQAQYSLYDVMHLVDSRITSDPIHFRRLTLPMRNFYEAWKNDGMQTWQLSKIPTPPEDDVIDVLMIGSSFCYYYVEELYGLADAAGVKMRVCNAYYSGCKFTWHYNWWKEGQSNYEFYQVTDSTGRKKTSAMSLEHCLAQGEWDVISIQESTSTIFSAGAQAHLDKTRPMRSELLGYLKEQFPEAKVYWHQPWSYQTGYKSGNTEIIDFAQQQERMMTYREFALGVCKENDVDRVNTGEAWQIYRMNYVDTDGLTDTLCARLGVGTNDVGDYYHDGDIGGGQYLNACVWFETIMNDLYPNENYTCVGNTFRPNYNGNTLPETLVTALQASAHQAVLERDWETPSTEGDQS